LKTTKRKENTNEPTIKNLKQNEKNDFPTPDTRFAHAVGEPAHCAACIGAATTAYSPCHPCIARYFQNEL
jgi:hypothetical protein